MEAKPEGIFDAEVGRLLCASLRDELGRLKLQYPTLRWHEGSGWLSHTFRIIGPDAALRIVAARIEYLNDPEGVTARVHAQTQAQQHAMRNPMPNPYGPLAEMLTKKDHADGSKAAI